MNEWQPIETAPKDWPHPDEILTLRHGLISVAAWNPNVVNQYDQRGGWVSIDGGFLLVGVTHWMPLPEPPEPTA